MKSKIAKRLTLYFSASLLLFALIIGVVFISIFRAQIISKSKSDLEARAINIASALSKYTYAFGTGSGNGAQGGKGSYGNYLRYIDDIAMTEVWIVDENLNLITNQAQGRQYMYSDLPVNAEEVVGEVFTGKTTFSENFSSLLEAPTLTVGTPIIINNEITGAVLLHSSVEGIDAAVKQGILILAVSLAAALILSLALSAVLAVSFTNPLNKMKKTALLLANGDYKAKTGISQKDETGELAVILDILSDRLLKAQSESLKLEKLRSDFISNISHELKTPVTVIRGSLEALNDGVITGKEQVQEYYSQMLNESLYLQRLINDLLELSKLQNLDFKIEFEHLSLNDILSDAVRSAGQLARSKNIEIELKSDELPHEIMGDYGRLRQLFLIILDNAVKFSPAESVIKVIINDDTVSISDNGPGISTDELPHIFDRFYKTRSENNKTGSGLGLPIAKQIAKRHNIDLEVQSEEGKGSTFTLKLP